MEAIKNKPLDKATFEHFKSRTWRSKNTEYWIDRAFRAEDAADKTTEELLRDMHKVYKNSLAELEKEIQAFYGRYAEENGLTLAEVHKRLDPKQLKSAQEEIKRYYDFAEPAKIGKKMSREYRDELRRLSARAYMSRLEEVKARLKHLVIKLAAEENKAYDKAMKEAYAEAHAQTSYTIDKGLGFSEGYSAPDGDTLAKAVNEKWLGENYSGRIWEDKGRLLTSIENELLTGIAQGHNPRKIADAMATKYGQDYRNCERLARTETIHMMNSAAYDSYKEHGIEKYQFVCGLDERTCPTCGALDGTVHDMRYAEEGVNFPVMHPNCRCTHIPFFEKDDIDEMFDEATRAAYDEGRKIYDVPASMSYVEWLETIGSSQRKAILGKERYEMHVNGTPISDFWKDGKFLKLSDIKAGAAKPVHSEADFKKLKEPLTQQEALKQTNPNFSKGFEYQNNCQRCCPAYEAIRRGYDVMAKPTTAKNADEILKDKFTDYESNAFASMYKSADVIKSKGFGKNEIKTSMKEWGDNSRCEICVVWRDNGSGHVFMAEQVDGKTVFLDPQSNRVYDDTVFDKVKKFYTKYFRVDNLEFNENISDCCLNRKEGKKDDRGKSS